MSSRPAVTSAPPRRGPPLLSVRDLQVHFPLGHTWLGCPRAWIRAVDGVDFDLWPGETLALVGESGSGKSTVGRACLRLIEPTGGRLMWQGQDLCQLSQAELRRQRRDFQIIFQDPLAALDPTMTIAAALAEPLRRHYPDVSPEDLAIRCKESLIRVGLPEAAGQRYPEQFSGGQAQRINIARALITRPKLVVCDEPTSALDVSVQAQIINLLADLRVVDALAFLFITHDLGLVRHFADRTMVLYFGQVMEIATTTSLFSAPQHPYSQALLRGDMLSGAPPSALNPASGCVFHSRCPKASERCRQVRPTLTPVGPDHLVACHHLIAPEDS